jgi:transcriptional regulator with XRE-family HTH domain
MKPTPDIAELRKIIGRNIRILREYKNLSRVQLGKALGYSSTGTISLIEAGERGLQLASLMQVSDYFGVHPAVLISKIPSENFDDFELVSRVLQVIELKSKQSEVATDVFLGIKVVLDTMPPFRPSPSPKTEEPA